MDNRDILISKSKEMGIKVTGKERISVLNKIKNCLPWG